MRSLTVLALATSLAISGCASYAQNRYTHPHGSDTIRIQKYGYDAEFPRQVRIPGKVIVIFIKDQYGVAYEHGQVAKRQGFELHNFIASGSEGYETPLTNPERGPHRIEYAEADYYSKTHPRPRGGAPMPHTLFFDHKEGLALHGGQTYRPKEMRGLPLGMSHGCVRLPFKLAEIIFTDFYDAGMRVIVTWDPATLRRDWEHGYFLRTTQN
ncbi:MAG: L,D-transpeptidase [Candidatus Pacebacteria bacterium]|nr:L,D-transpeptidase [Candidatus Paceibacterota bacterium]